MMWQRKKRSLFILLLKAIAIALLIVIFIRCFFVESFTVTSSQMEASLLGGDHLIVNKTAYGIRMPVSVFGIPFTFDRFMGIKSYSDVITFPYKRFFEKNANRNDVVLYNNPGQINKPLDRRSLLLGRVIALPGDSLSISGNNCTVNNRAVSFSPDMIHLYHFPAVFIDTINHVARKLDIHMYNAGKIQDSSLFVYMSHYNTYLLNREISRSINLLTQVPDADSYAFTVPYKGMTIQLTPENQAIYGQAIMAEMEKRAGIVNGDLVVDYKKPVSYTFGDNYYWVLCDNTINSIDSRKIGFIPHKCIVGKASSIWFSKDKQSGVRKERCLTDVK